MRVIDNIIKGACAVAGAVAGIFGEWNVLLTILAVCMLLVILAVTVIIAGGSINHQLLRIRRMFPSLRKRQSRQ